VGREEKERGCMESGMEESEKSVKREENRGLYEKRMKRDGRKRLDFSSPLYGSSQVKPNLISNRYTR
jgi:hypothetical protein